LSHTKYNTGFREKQQSLVKWLEPGIFHFGAVAQVPQNVISDATLHRICEAIDDDILARSAEDLGVDSRLALYETARLVPNLDTALATIEGRDAMRRWTVEHQPILVLQALEKLVRELSTHIAKRSIQDLHRTVKIVLVLALVPFFPKGADLLSEFTTILKCHEPHRMIKKFAKIAIRGESETIRKMDDIILSSRQWDEWSCWFMGRAQSLAHQCWGRLVVSKKSVDPTPWNRIWHWLLDQRGGIE
jgi:hypothetical protein